MKAVKGDAHFGDKLKGGIHLVIRPLHSVIANVGIDNTTDELDLDDETWAANLNQNLMGAVRLAREAASRLTGSQDGKAGNIVLISSIAGLRGFGGPLPYAVSKSGINQLAFELGMRLGRDSGIRVNSVAPGNILFPGGVWERMLAADAGSVGMCPSTVLALPKKSLTPWSGWPARGPAL